METAAGRELRAHLGSVLVAILVLGSIWGLSEVVLGGALRAAGFPYAGALLTGIGIGVMGIGAGAYRKPAMLVGIPFVAVLCKQMVVPILGVSALCKANSCLAVLLEGLALAGVVALAGRRLERGDLGRIASGFSAGLLSAGAFYFAGMQVAPCPYLLSFNHPGGFAAFLAAEGLLWAAFAGVLFPVGHWVGARVGNRVPALARRPVLYYAGSALVVACCWVASALAIAAGL
jgi:hypothetical protein